MKGDSKSLLLAILIGVVSVFLVNYYIKTKERAMLELSTPVRVVSAVKDIPEGTRLEDGLFELIAIPKVYLQSGAILNIDQVRDQISSVAILTGNQVLGSMLAKNEDIGLSRKIPRGKTAQTVSVDNVSGIAGLLQPGDYVDLIVTVEVQADASGAQAGTETVSKKILGNIQVLAVDQRSYRSTTSEASNVFRNGIGNRVASNRSSSSNAGHNGGIATVTLILEDDQVLPLSLAQQVGTISLALKSAWETENKQTLGDVADELGSYELLGISKPIARNYYDVFSRARKSRIVN